MNETISAADAARFRAISETCRSHAFMRQFILRLIQGVSVFNKLGPGDFPPELRKELAQLPRPHPNEKRAIAKLASSLFSKYTLRMAFKPKNYRIGFLCAGLVALGRELEDPSLTDQDRDLLHSFIMLAFRFGPLRDNMTLERAQSLIDAGKKIYEEPQRFLDPKESLRDFYLGFADGHEMCALGDKVLDDSPDSAKVHFTVALLGPQNAQLRSRADLHRFIQDQTNLKLAFDWDSFVSACKRIKWHGARYLQSMRLGKSGGTFKPAAP